MKRSAFQIFIFEDKPEHMTHLKKLFSMPGCRLGFEENLYQATKRFKAAPFDLSIISLDMPDQEGEELAQWLIDNYPRRSMILTGQELLPEHEDLLASKSVLGFFPAPLDPQVITRVMGQSDKGLRGQVQRMQVPDLLQALRWSHKAITLQFSDAILQQEAVVYLQKGEVCHAELYQRNSMTQERILLNTGPEAFDQLLNFRNGTFSELIWQEPSEKTIQVPFDGLMMNAAQRKDEALWNEAEEGPRVRKAILIDDVAMSRMMLQQALLAEGIDCMSLRSLDLVKPSLEAQQSDLLILDAQLAETEIHATLSWLKKTDQACRILLLGQPAWKTPMPLPFHVLPRPVSPKRLKEILFELTQVGFRGYLNRIGVLEFLQLNLSAIDDFKKMHIRDLSNGVDGQIYIDRGRLIHAEFADLQGEDAFYRIAAIEKGDFFEDPAFEPPARSLADIMPHKLMINAGRFVKPLDDPDEADELEESFANQDDLSAEQHLGGVASKLGEVEAMSAGSLNLFGEDDLQDIQLNLSGAAPASEPAEGGMTSLFGDDEMGEIQLNLGGALASEPAEGGMTSLFGDDEMGEIQLNLGGALASEPAEGGMTSLFGDDEMGEIQLNLGGVAPAPEAVLQPETEPAPEPQTPAPTKGTSKLDEMRAQWEARRSQMLSKKGTAPLASPAPVAEPQPTAGLSAGDKLKDLRARFAQIRKTGPLPMAPAAKPSAPARQAPPPVQKPVKPLTPEQRKLSDADAGLPTEAGQSFFSDADLEDLNFSLG